MSHPRLRTTLFSAYLLLSLAYLVWRAAYTLNLEHPVYAVIFYIAESFCILTSIAFYILILHRQERPQPPQPTRWPGIDVLIATYNEELHLVRSTAVAARDMLGPHRTIICDDGRRPEMAALARELGVDYITRENNAHYKAGNLNHALTQCDGELVLVLDADHVCRPQMLQRLVPHFADPKLALVQTPQVFYNIDSYQHNVSARGRRLWHEASMFHHMMQPGADRLGACFFVGTGALLRRAALDEVGGFATLSITEDIHTSMRLHAAGYRSLYVDEALGMLLAPDTPYGFANQRLRWAQGAMQILRRENPLKVKGLSRWQRMGYCNSLAGYLSAYQHLIFYLAPGLFLMAGVSPIAVEPRLALPIFVGHILVDLLIYNTLARPHARLFLAECYKMLSMALHIQASLTLLKPEGLRFKVTPKGRHGGLPLSLVLPPAAIFLFNLTAAGLGVARLLRGDDYPGAVCLAIFFAGFFAIAGALALIHAYERRHSHEGFTVPVSAAARLRGARQTLDVRVRRLNHDVAYVLSPQALEPDATLQLDLGFTGLADPVSAHVDASEPGHGGWVVKLQLTDLSGPERDMLDHYLFNGALPRLFAGLSPCPPVPEADPALPPPEQLAAGEPLILRLRQELI